MHGRETGRVGRTQPAPDAVQRAAEPALRVCTTRVGYWLQCRATSLRSLALTLADSVREQGSPLESRSASSVSLPQQGARAKCLCTQDI